MTLNLVYLGSEPAAAWRDAMRDVLADANFSVWPNDAPDPAVLDYALVWNPPAGALAKFPNLKGILNLGAGVDALLQDRSLPRTVPIVRLVDPLLTSGMTEYAAHWVLHFHRDFHIYAEQQAHNTWSQRPAPDTARRRIGILGLGALGGDVARTLQALGFKDIAGWSRTAKDAPGVQSFAGKEELAAFLNRSEILVCLLPHTLETEGLINADTLAELPAGASIINAGRGAIIDDGALLAALDRGHVQAAALDVFSCEPLAGDHPYWSHPRVFVTPHIASVTIPAAAAPVIADAIGKLEAGQTPDNLVDLDAGY